MIEGKLNLDVSWTGYSKLAHFWTINSAVSFDQTFSDEIKISTERKKEKNNSYLLLNSIIIGLYIFPSFTTFAEKSYDSYENITTK